MLFPAQAQLSLGRAEELREEARTARLLRDSRSGREARRPALDLRALLGLKPA